MIKIWKEILEFALLRKRWWLLPLILTFLLFGGLILFTGSASSPMAPFLYSFF